MVGRKLWVMDGKFVVVAIIIIIIIIKKNKRFN